jgi:hypothetical protein
MASYIKNNRLSRREFLKLLGLFGAMLALGGFRELSQLATKQQFGNLASAQSAGSWSNGNNTSIPAIHAALLPTNRIFYLAGSGWSKSRQFGPFEARVLNYSSGLEKSLEQSKDLFCMGQTSLADGNLLLAGGSLLYNGNPNNCNGQWHGLKAAYRFTVGTESLAEVISMKHGRWYPTLVTLANGKVWCCGGLDEYGVLNRIIEVYDPSSGLWTITPVSNQNYSYCVGQGYEGTCSGAGSPCYSRVCPPSIFYSYPRAHLLPKGLVVICGMRKEIWSWNPSNGYFNYLGTSSRFRYYGTSFLIPCQNTTSEKGKILLVGGSPTGPDYATTTCEILDFNASTTSSPVIRNVSPIAYRRKWLAPVILPNGKLLVLGGAESNSSNPVFYPEVFDPISETWKILARASVPRVYHQVALLLPDGRVWNAGGTPKDGVWELRTQFFSPDYLFAGTRPTISGTPTVGAYGGSITIPTPSPSAISSVSLVRLMNTTHHYDANQRLVWLQIKSRASTSITVSAPINANIAPPGYYMIHVLNSSKIPSIAKIIKIPA